jgi:hypothetical protein
VDDGVLVLDVLDNAADQPVGTLGCRVDGDEFERSQWLSGRHFVRYVVCVIEKQKTRILVQSYKEHMFWAVIGLSHQNTV